MDTTTKISFDKETFIAFLDDLADGVSLDIQAGREAGMRAWWTIGKRITEETATFERQEIYGKKLMEYIAKGLSERLHFDFSTPSVYKCKQIYEKWPRFEKIYELPEGNNISLHKLVHLYLPDPKKKRERKISCKQCLVPGHCK